MQNYNVINGKVLVFTDQHLGLKGNSEARLKIVVKVFKEVISYAKANDIHDVISMGDMFHSRSSIDVNVLNVGYKLVQALAKHCRVWLIVGNHDQYLKNTTEINSINMFQDIPNVTLVDKPLDVMLNGKHATLVPWQGDLSQYSKDSVDYLFGHFDVSSKFIMQAFTAANANTLGDSEVADVSSFIDIVKPDGIAFSGHIHTRKEMVVKGKSLVFVGSPYQQTLADVGLKCGFYVLNQAGEMTFVEIQTVPKHVQLKMSAIVSDVDKFDFSVVKGNIVHKTYDVEVDRATDAKIQQKILDMKPFEELLPDYEVAVIDDAEQESSANIELLKKSKLEYISNYIDNIDQTALDNEHITKKKLFSTLEKYYNEVI